MNIRCEKCGQSYEVDPKYDGKIVQCECGAEIVVPLPEPKQSVPAVRAKFSPANLQKRNSLDAVSGFAVPKIAKWFYEIGKLIIAISIVFSIFGIIAVCADGAKRLYYPILAFSAIIPGVLMMGGGKALEYLAEIAFNTRKK